MAALLAPLLIPLVGAVAAPIVANVAILAGTTAASYFLNQAEQPKQNVGTKLRAATGGAVALSMIVGEAESAGSVIYRGLWGRTGKTENSFYVRVFAMSDLQVNALKTGSIWLGEVKRSIDLTTTCYTSSDTATSGISMGNPVPGLDHDGFHYVYVKFLDGTQTVADPYLREVFGSHPTRPWKASMIGRGRPLLIVTQAWTNLEGEANEEKSVLGVFQGRPMYDWRKDSTNGGSGSHRWGTYSTYEWTANPIVIIYNVMRGIHYGSTWMYGGQNWPARRFDNDTWTAAANVADQNVSLAGGGTRKRYRCGGEISFSEQPTAVIDRLLASAAARMVESGGIYKIYSGGIGASVFSFTDADVVVTESLSGKMFPSRDEICNTIAGSYVEPENAGQMKAYKKRSKAAYIANDNDEVRSKEMSFDFVRDNGQAQALALHALNDNRRFMTKVVAFPSIARKLEPGDPINWSDSARFGFTNKKFIVGDVTLSDNGVVLCMLREVDATDADWTTGDEDPFTVGVYGDIVPATQTFAASVSNISITNNAGTARRPGIRIYKTLDRDDRADAKALKYRVRLKDTLEIIDSGRDDDFFENNGLAQVRRTNSSYLPGEDVQVSYKLIPESDRTTAWSDWENITLGHIKFLRSDIAAGAIGIAETDVNPPNIPANPVLTSYTGDVDDDDTIDTGLTITITAPAVDSTHQAAQRYNVQLWRSATSGGTYTYFRTYPTDDLTFDVEVPQKYFYKARIKAFSFNGLASIYSTLTGGSTGVQPLKYLGTIPTPTSFTAVAVGNGARLDWAQATFASYKDTVITATYSGGGPDTFTTKSNHFNDTKSRAVGLVVTYAIQHRDTQNRVGSNATGIPVTYRQVIAAEIGSNEVTTAKIAPLAVTSAEVAPLAILPSKKFPQDPTNYVNDPELLELSNFAVSGGGAALTQIVNNTKGGSKFMLVATGVTAGTVTIATAIDIPVEDTESYYVRCFMGQQIGAIGSYPAGTFWGFGIYIDFYDTDASGNPNTLLGSQTIKNPVMNPAAAFGYYGLEGVATPVAGAQIARLRFTCLKQFAGVDQITNLYISSPAMRRRARQFEYEPESISALTDIQPGTIRPNMLDPFYELEEEYSSYTTSSQTCVAGVDKLLESVTSHTYDGNAVSAKIEMEVKNVSGSAKTCDFRLEGPPGTTLKTWPSILMQDNGFVSFSCKDNFPSDGRVYRLYANLVSGGSLSRTMLAVYERAR